MVHGAGFMQRLLLLACLHAACKHERALLVDGQILRLFKKRKKRFSCMRTVLTVVAETISKTMPNGVNSNAQLKPCEKCVRLDTCVELECFVGFLREAWRWPPGRFPPFSLPENTGENVAGRVGKNGGKSGQPSTTYHHPTNSTPPTPTPHPTPNANNNKSGWTMAHSMPYLWRNRHIIIARIANDAWRHTP